MLAGSVIALVIFDLLLVDKPFQGKAHDGSIIPKPHGVESFHEDDETSECYHALLAVFFCLFT